VLELRNVSASYGQIVAVRDLSVSLNTGQCLALLGRNGAGKSTLLKLIAGMVSPGAGSVYWNGVDVSSEPPERRLHDGIVLVPEGRGIFPALSVAENLRMGAYWERPSASVYRARYDQVLTYFPKLKILRKQAAGSLSGGEQQMVAVARALMSDPKLLLLDEPSLGLAPMVVESLYEVFGELVKTSMTIVVVEQFVEYALKLADEVVALNKGDIVLTGTPAELISNPVLSEVYMAGRVGQQEAAQADLALDSR
jgi:ABC-type branched-subunit amino acid transport system ATPase component